MTLDELPADLRGLIATYKEQKEGSVAAWSNTSGSIADNADRVSASDRLDQEAKATRAQIEAACTRYSLDFETVWALTR